MSSLHQQELCQPDNQRETSSDHVLSSCLCISVTVLWFQDTMFLLIIINDDFANAEPGLAQVSNIVCCWAASSLIVTPDTLVSCPSQYDMYSVILTL